MIGCPQNPYENSILSKMADGVGFYYGYLPASAREKDGRQINVRHEQDGILRWQRWFGYVAGEKVTAGFATLIEAEQAAIAWMGSNPPDEG